MFLGKKQVFHDHYSLWNLKTTGSSTEIQLFKVCPRGNGGSPVSVALWSSISTMSMLMLPNVSTITSSSSPCIISGLMNLAERNEELSGGMSIFMLFASFPRKLATLFYLFSLISLCLSCLLGLYPNPNLSFFWITVIGLNMPCSRFPNPFPARAPLSGTCFMPR